MSSHDPAKTCFVIAPIGQDGSPTRDRSDKMLKHIIKPAAVECGLEAVRGDQIDKPGLITNQVIEHIANDRMVVADLAERNANVFYELALRHALRMPCVHLIEQGGPPPFDLGDVRTIQVDHTDLDSVEECRTKIVSYIQSALTSQDAIETPISVALSLAQLRESGDQSKVAYAELVVEVTELRREIAELTRALCGGWGTEALTPSQTRERLAEFQQWYAKQQMVDRVLDHFTAKWSSGGRSHVDGSPIPPAAL